MRHEELGTSLAEDLQNYVAGFSFRFLQPAQSLPAGLGFHPDWPEPPLTEEWFTEQDSLLATTQECVSRSDWHDLPESVARQFDVFNTVHSDRDRVLKHLSPIFGIQRMSTLSMAMIINWLVERLPGDAAYVNVGVWHGFTLLAGMLNNADKSIIGIDNFSEFDGPRDQCLKVFARHKSEKHQLLDMDYREFLAHRRAVRIGLYFYDAAHDYNDQLVSLCMAEPFFSDGCVVITDDSNWAGPRQAVIEFLRPRKRRYRLLVDARTVCNAHPTYWNGFLIFQKRPGVT